MAYTNKNRIVTVSIIILQIFFLQACSSQSNIKNFSQQQKELLSNALMIVEVPDKRFEGYSQNMGQQVGMQYGAFGVLIGALIDGAAKQIEKSQDKKKRLYYDAMGWLIAVDFKEKLASTLEIELNTIPWIKLKRTDTDSNIRKSWVKRRMELLDLDSAIYVKAGYLFSDDRKCINLDANYSVYQKNDSIKKHYQSRSEYSTCHEEETSSDVYLEKWVENNGSMIKIEMDKGINELASKIKEDLKEK